MLPHQEPPNPNPNPKPKRKPPSDPAFAFGTTAIPPCTECGKRFSSWKALFGHMRCHPERQWRGINPPPHLRHNFPDFRHHQLQLAVGPTNAEHRRHHHFFSADEYAVAASLLLLANGPPKGSGRTGCAAIAHHCGVCDRRFSSGQALGGHMRCHWPSTTSAGLRGLVLDLNLPPPVEADAYLDLTLGMG